MRYLSVCSGIEAASCAWHPLGWEPFAFSEIEAFPSAVLAYHYPDVPNLGDMTKFKEWSDATVDVFVGGTPCQSFSVAGLRKGLDDPRGNLMLTYLAIAARYRPRWMVWENVPGVLSSNGGRDFAAFIRGLDELGYGWAYRVLDAQYFGVAQRRRRVFVVGHLGNYQRAAAVLFERHSLQGHPAPRREARKDVAGGAARSVAIRGRNGTPQAELGDEVANAILTPNGGRGGVGVGATLVPMPHADISPAIKARDGKGVSSDGDGDGAILVPMVAHSLRAEGFDASEDGTGRGTPLVPVCFSAKDDGADSMFGLSPTLRAAVMPAVAFAENSRSEIRLEGGDGTRTGALSTGGDKPGQGVPMATPGMNVRRLTPRECERLQGFDDDYTLIPYRGKAAADGPRYKALGNSMAVPVMAWIGRRIAMVDSLEIRDLGALVFPEKVA